jgi:hypothetical protein
VSGIARSAVTDRQWFIVGRWQEYDGETRANLLRILAIGAFYVVELANFYLVHNASEGLHDFHRAATAIAVCWSLVALGNLLCLRRQIFPAWLKFVSTGADILLLTALATLGNKSESPLVLVYFLIIALAAVRFSLRLIWCATLGSMTGYMALVGVSDQTWFDANHETPIVTQLITLLSLGLTGIILGQVIRRTRTLADEYAERIQQVARENE